MNSIQKGQFSSSFPSRLKAERTKRGWSQAKVAELLEIETKTVSRWECGESLPVSYLRPKISALFEMSVQDLGLLETLESFASLSSFDPAIPLLPSYPLVGRDRQLAILRQRLCGSNGMLNALSGLPGVGKTALSVALANDPEVRAHFTGGVLWAGLGPKPNVWGYILRWGAMLGIPPDEMNDGTDINACLFALRLAIGERTILLLLPH